MRLLFVIDYLGSGGAQRQMVNLALELLRRGHTIELFMYYREHNHFGGLLQEAGIPLHSCPKRGRFSLAPMLGLRRLVKERRYDTMLAFLPTPSLYAELAHIRIRGMSLVVSERFMYTSESLPLATWVLQQAHRLADHVTVNSHHQRERMERIFPWMRGRLTTIYNGVDLIRFAPQWNSNGHSGRLRLLVLSSVVPKKNAVGLVRALARYRALYGDTCTVRWAGQVTSDTVSQQEFAEANRLLVELGLREQWEWLGERKDIPELLGAHDALIHPSFYEGLPNAICEALACGRPVLASAVCDHPRLVQEDVTGFLFDPGKADDVAHAIHKCRLLSGEERVRMGRRARQYAESELSLDRCSRRYETLFSRLMERDSLGNG
jgi:GalNAc-alpha-(1->4)-GalNAc-alpha-(1->3)-diNAcBac-PP-undecaprenol alpha-1,4-N-acetyl-D-galactosaminyltransferase